MAYLLPMNKIFTVIDRKSGEILKRGGRHIEIIPHPANTGIGIKAA
jgi:hypothetical protein